MRRGKEDSGGGMGCPNIHANPGLGKHMAEGFLCHSCLLSSECFDTTITRGGITVPADPLS